LRATIRIGFLGAAAGLALLWGQELEQPPFSGDPSRETPPTKAFREAVRVKGVGVKIGEVTQRSAVIWTRVPPVDEVAYRKKRDALSWVRALFFEDDLQVRLRYGLREDLSDARWRLWRDADIEEDFIEQWFLDNLRPNTLYHFEVEGADEQRRTIYDIRRGSFRTAPDAADPQPVTFTAVTGQRYDRLDHPEGFEIYPSMAALEPGFAVMTGDTVYFDRGPMKATNVEMALEHWRRLYELPRLMDFHARIPTYWEKDDHDVLRDDASPYSPPFGKITFQDGVRLFRMHTPVSPAPYRRFRWGRLLEVWLPEVREFRDANLKPDGPDKSMLGATQKAWLKRTLLASDASWRIIVNPTPIVGPDRPRYKHDNHANKAWAWEGDELRQWFANHLGDNFFIVAGDRHWQYHSIDPDTGVHEYACGPASDMHAGGSPGFDDEYHRFHRVGGGFLSVSVERQGRRDIAVVRLHDVNGGVVYEDRRERPASP
jgi:alkaline phosphatase D